MVSGAGSGGSELAGPLARDEAEFLRRWGPLPPLKICPIGWQPSALTPVFYGYRDYTTQLVSERVVVSGSGVGAEPPAPVNMRVFFPSLDGSPQYASVLAGCGRYPLVLFAHGDCQGDPEHYLKWYELPAQLARAGYVVAVPQIPDIEIHPPENVAGQQALLSVLSWMRESWGDRDVLMPAPATGLAGHSFGALHVGILATKVEVQCAVSLSGVWTDWSTPPWPITEVTIPQLFTWGTGPTDLFATLPDSLWDSVPAPKHRVIFAGGEHFDYLSQTALPCRERAGPCPWLGAAAADYTTMFFGRYLPPELWPNLPDEIPGDLQPPPLTLTPAQQFYGGAYLQGAQAFSGDSSCSMDVTEQLPQDRTVPYVLYSPANTAARAVEERDLVPVFSTTIETRKWVSSQSPAAGTAVQAGTEVQMTLTAGSLP